MQSIQAKARKLALSLPAPASHPKAFCPGAGGGMRLWAASTLPDNCGYSEQHKSRRQPQERGHEASEAPTRLRADCHGHSLSVISPRPWAYSRSRSLVTSSFSSRISLLLGSSLIMALQRICLARSAYLDSKGIEELGDGSTEETQGCSEPCLVNSAGEKILDLGWQNKKSVHRSKG